MNDYEKMQAEIEVNEEANKNKIFFCITNYFGNMETEISTIEAKDEDEAYEMAEEGSGNNEHNTIYTREELEALNHKITSALKETW